MADANVIALTSAIQQLISRLELQQNLSSNSGPEANINQFVASHNLIFEYFDDSKESFKSYKERLENFFALKQLSADNSETNVAKARIFINSIGSKNYMLLCSLTAPISPVELPYKKLVEVLEQHLCPPPNVFAEQHKFLCRTQGPDECIADFIAALRQLTITCKFDCYNEGCHKSVANLFLRAQFIRGLSDSSIRERLLQETTLTFDRASEIALSLEASKQGNKNISVSNSINRISHARPKPLTRKPQDSPSSSYNQHRTSNSHQHASSQVDFKALGIDDVCLRCGLNNHRVNDCRRDRSKIKCASCGRVGHVSKVCIVTLTNQGRNKRHNIRHIDDISIDEPQNVAEQSDFSVFQIIDINYNSPSSDDSKFIVPVKLAHKIQEFEIDSGSPVSIMSCKDFKNLNLGLQIAPTCVEFRTYTKETFRPLGVVKVPVEYKGTKSIEDLFIVHTGSAAILGRTWLRRLHISINQINTVQNTQNNSTVAEQITRLYADVFESKIGTIPNYRCSLQTKSPLKPVYLKPRQIPHVLKEKVDRELDMLESEGVITKTNYSDWGSPLVVVPKPNGDVRLCYDYNT